LVGVAGQSFCNTIFTLVGVAGQSFCNAIFL